MISGYQSGEQRRFVAIFRQLRWRLRHALAGLTLAALFAAVPNWMMFGDAVANGRNAMAEFSSFFLISLLGVILIGLPIGLVCLSVLARNDVLSAKSLIASGLLVSSVLGFALILGLGWFGVLFVPGLLIAGAVMAVTYWFWIRKPFDDHSL